MSNEQDDAKYMAMALDACAAGVEAGQSPFGACVVREGKVLACEHNRVWLNTDITAHAEVQAIRAACMAAETIDLSGSVIYSTTEPCPMCFSAIHWARIDRIVYGASIGDAQAAGFNELPISNQQLKQLGHAPVHVEGGCRREQCVELFHRWQGRADHRAY